LLLRVGEFKKASLKNNEKMNKLNKKILDVILEFTENEQTRQLIKKDLEEATNNTFIQYIKHINTKKFKQKWDVHEDNINNKIKQANEIGQEVKNIFKKELDSADKLNYLKKQSNARYIQDKNKVSEILCTEYIVSLAYDIIKNNIIRRIEKEELSEEFNSDQLFKKVNEYKTIATNYIDTLKVCQGHKLTLKENIEGIIMETYAAKLDE
jgi:hypothetical protein